MQRHSDESIWTKNEGGQDAGGKSFRKLIRSRQGNRLTAKGGGKATAYQRPSVGDCLEPLQPTAGEE
ncbi:MAG: hypothetical protein CMM00_10465 [Rhodopirellula sp.]|nr:hypothetical protein [Rhodopirellula sp.]